MTSLPTSVPPLPSDGDVMAVAAYGTLRPACSNHFHTWSGLTGWCEEGYVDDWLLLGDGEPFPYAVPEPGARTMVTLVGFHPEDWRAALRASDSLEGYPVLYDRRVVTVTLVAPDLPGPPLRRAWLYHPRRDAPRRGSLRAGLTPVPGGDWYRASSFRHAAAPPSEQRRAWHSAT